MPELIEPKKISDSAAVIAECEEIDGEIAALKAAYEQYFMGLEKRPPTDKHKALTKRIQKLRNTWTRQTAAKFRVQSLAQKWSTYERLWSKTMLAIENGTYTRDLARIKRKQVSASTAPVPKRKDALDDLEIDDVLEDVSGESMDQALAAAAAAAEKSVSAPKPAPVAPSISPVIPPIAPPSTPAAAPATAAPGSAPKIAPLTPAIPPLTPAIAPVIPPIAAARPSSPGVPAVKPVSTPPAAATRALTGNTTVRPATTPPLAARPGSTPPGARPGSSAGGAQLSEDKLRAVYDAFVKAKRRCNEDTSSMSYDQVATSLRKQVPELMKQHNAKSVEFKVVIKDGKAVLRAVPKDG